MKQTRITIKAIPERPYFSEMTAGKVRTCNRAAATAKMRFGRCMDDQTDTDFWHARYLATLQALSKTLTAKSETLADVIADATRHYSETCAARDARRVELRHSSFSPYSDMQFLELDHQSREINDFFNSINQQKEEDALLNAWVETELFHITPKNNS